MRLGVRATSLYYCSWKSEQCIKKWIKQTNTTFVLFIYWYIRPRDVRWLTNSVAPDPEGSSLHSQQPANGPYPEPGESTPHPPTNPVRSILIPSAPWSFKWSSSFGLSHQNPLHISPLSYACHMPRPPFSLIWFDLANNIWWEVWRLKRINRL
jgi:hypothetical protein